MREDDRRVRTLGTKSRDRQIHAEQPSGRHAQHGPEQEQQNYAVRRQGDFRHAQHVGGQHRKSQHERIENNERSNLDHSTTIVKEEQNLFAPNTTYRCPIALQQTHFETFP